MPSLIVWMLNGVVMAAVLARLFVFGEPVTKPLTASSVSYWRSRRQADVYLATVGGLLMNTVDFVSKTLRILKKCRCACTFSLCYVSVNCNCNTCDSRLIELLSTGYEII